MLKAHSNTLPHSLMHTNIHAHNHTSLVYILYSNSQLRLRWYCRVIFIIIIFCVKFVFCLLFYGGLLRAALFRLRTILLFYIHTGIYIRKKKNEKQTVLRLFLHFTQKTQPYITRSFAYSFIHWLRKGFPFAFGSSENKKDLSCTHR